MDSITLYLAKHCKRLATDGNKDVSFGAQSFKGFFIHMPDSGSFALVPAPACRLHEQAGRLARGHRPYENAEDGMALEANRGFVILLVRRSLSARAPALWSEGI